MTGRVYLFQNIASACRYQKGMIIRLKKSLIHGRKNVWRTGLQIKDVGLCRQLPAQENTACPDCCQSLGSRTKL